ncbi:MAG: amino acid adenylation domain-containing protein [Gammaproteobacteria bacterium]|nr:amino acid adenylation domain-containing protein [Gammaproteobacteria bacterium]MCP4090691.1 amino acid adenylation domain-containing protein [Gammaproteobacteria bacterium]MCP4277118.1 amino acid adenylation domain-containing protein [Gammaproteobacteria bacterium]MCP4832674.1 amino acid adenylation domain-containing protein [Gammaproteobacteria bacterium]MCP4928072.1 amino acid adenylation domain-containing protein [Gammaproteobacteria bacterium]
MTQLLLHRFEGFAAERPDAIAIRCLEDVLSYAELNQQANQLAATLLVRGVSPGELIGLSAEPSVEMMVGMLGILKAGCAWVPLDPDGVSQRLNDIILQAELKLVLTGAAIELPDADVVCLSVNNAVGVGEVDSEEARLNLAPEIKSEDLCYVMFTSGSTGTPNGVMVSHGNIAGLFDGLHDELELTAADHWSALHAFTFGYSIWETWGALSTGACLEIIPESVRKDPAAWLPLVLESGVTALSITPSGFRQLLAADCLPATFDALRLIVFSGEAVNAADIASWFSRYGAAGPRLINTYALTETSGRITWYEYSPKQKYEPGCIGWPVSDAAVYILNDALLPVADGEVGELYVGGPMLAAGYLGNLVLTNERFVELDPGAGKLSRLYKTGDRAYALNSGEIVFAGRLDDQIKLRGHRIDLGDIESALRRHPAVADAAVVLQTDGVVPQLAAFVVAEDCDAEVSAKEIEFWPSLGEYQIYDELLYDFMSADEVRVASYKRAFERQVKDKTVLDIGTGKDAILARLAAAAGAKKVYAVEVLDDAYESASHLVKRLGLDDRIEVLHGDMQSVEISSVIDVCTQGIIGNIGSSDGIAPIWNGARALFASEFSAIPSVCTTLIAPAQLPEGVRGSAQFSPLAVKYTKEIFRNAGHEFDVRLCVRNFPLEGLLAEAAEFEQLNFQAELSADYQGQTVFVVNRDSSFDGFLLWTNIQTDEHESVDFLQHQQAWLPVWFPVADDAVSLSKGDRLQTQWRCLTPAGQIFPDYEIEVTIERQHAANIVLQYATRHFENSHGSTALHSQLLAGMQRHSEHAAVAEPGDIKSWLLDQLPVHMQPNSWVHLPSLPLNTSGKVDRQQLRALTKANDEVEMAAVETADPLQNDISAIWCDVLGHEQISHTEDFFDLGGDSILAVRLTTEVQRYLDDTVFLAALFDAPTIATYTQWLRDNHGEAVARQLDSQQTAESDLSELITAGMRDVSAELSFPQQSLLFLQQLYPDSTGANEQFLIRITGGADVACLRDAWHQLLGRHDVLRSCFDFAGTLQDASQRSVSLAQCLQNNPVEMVSLADMPTEAAAGRLAADAASAINEAFDLQQAPLLRACIYVMPSGLHQEGVEELILLVTAHHIIADGMCVQLIRDELAQIYAALTKVISDEFDPPEFQYADFARWQRSCVTDQGIQSEINWWQENLAGHHGQPVTLTQLPAAGQGEKQLQAQGDEARYAFSINAELADNLRQLARDAGATPFMLLLAAWRVWLSRCLSDKDLLLGSPVTLRRDEATAEMLGCMVNNVVFRNPLDMSVSFAEVLKTEREVALGAVEHSNVPFEKVVEAIQPERLLGRHPLFQLMFLFEDRTAPPVSIDGLSFAADVLPVDRASYWDLELSVADCGAHEAIQAFIGVRRDIYDAQALAWWPEAFLSMLEAIAVNVQTKITDLPLLSSAQRKQVLVEWNDTQLEIPADETLDDLVWNQAQRTPDAIAVCDYQGQVTYAELIGMAEQFAQALLVRGVVQGDLVGLCVERSITSIVLQLAIIKCGAAWLPLDPGYPLARLTLMLEDAQPGLIVCSYEGPLSDVDASITVTELEQTDNQAVDSVFPVIKSADIAYALYTSGSTGTPKGVLATHVSAVSRCRWMWQTYDFSDQDVFGQRTSLNFVDSVWEIFGALAHGARVDVLSVTQEPDPQAILEWIKRQGITHIALVPSLLRALLDVPAKQDRLKSLHTLISSGESLSCELARRVHKLLPECRLLNTYGTSETWDVSCHEVLYEDIGKLQESTNVPVGRPVANASLCILDETMQPLPPGVEGELYAGGAGLAREYLGKPELTATHFVGNPLGELATKRLYRTGDRARYQADGTVELLGRKDRQIKLRGIRIEAGEIESQVIARSDIADCTVVLRSDTGRPDWLALYVVPSLLQPELKLDLDELRSYLYMHLPRTMVPADIYVIDTMPLTPSGKVDLAALPLNAGVGLPGKYEAPRNELEQCLVRIWSDALAVEQVGIRDNFFALRGHSLLATQVIARVGEKLQLEIPLQFIFEAPTIAGLAESIEALRWAAANSVVSGGGSGREVVRL